MRKENNDDATLLKESLFDGSEKGLSASFNAEGLE